MYFGAKVFFLFFCVSNVFSEKCRTPNNEEAECVPIRSCPTLLESLATLRPEAIEWVKKHQCGFTTEVLVCCGSSATYTTSTAPPKTENKMDLLPSRRYCGYQRFDDYFHMENETSVPSIDEFPWLAGLVYDYEKEKGQIWCTGSLISNKYVLSAAHCLKPRFGKLVAVRLGEYNIEKEEDCMKSGQYDTECIDTIRDFGVEEMITHAEFRNRPRQHNIGLIRLNKTVTYNDFVRPICLPFTGTKFAKVGDILYESGWGKRTFDGERPDVKKKIAVELLAQERCIEAYKNIVNITEYQMCGLEAPSSADMSCGEDGGGPLMFFNRHQWHQEGIVWFGKRCALNTPSVKLKVSKYLDWILDNIRP